VTKITQNSVYHTPPYSDIFFIFKILMLHHWLPSQEGFGIKWWQAFGTCLNNKKTSFLNVTKLKSESNCDDFLI
jgi:hypothetical protein